MSRMSNMSNLLMACIGPEDVIELENDELVKPEAEKKTQYWRWSILFSYDSGKQHDNQMKNN